MKNSSHTKCKAAVVLLFSIVLFSSCNDKNKSDKEKNNTASKAFQSSEIKDIAYADDVSSMKNYVEIIELTDESNNSKVAISPVLQGRIMTSSAFGDKGRRY